MCQNLGIHNEITKLKNGYDTILNSPDDNLKENTKILLNIVRILLKDTKIMIFDEVLGSLNNDSRSKVLKMLRDIKDNHTIIVVDKNIDILNEADNIVFIDNNEVISVGIHEDLIKNSLYKKVMEN